MKKKVAWLMAWIMILSMLPYDVAKALPEVGLLQQSKLRIDEELKQLDVVDNGVLREETSVELDISKEGNYLVEYYIQPGTTLQKVSMNFVVGPDSIDVETKVQDSGKTGTDRPYMEKNLKVTPSKWPDPNTVTTEGAITATLNRSADAPFVDKGQVLGVKGENIRISYRISEKNSKAIIITTNGIKPGNITPFRGTYNGISKPEDRVEILGAFDEFKVSPTHLIEQGGEIVSSQQPIRYPEKAGSKPGMKVEFKHPQEIDPSKIWQAGSDFKFVPMKNGTNLKANLNIKDFVKGKGDNIQLHIDFAEAESSVIVNGRQEEKGKKLYKDGKHIIFIAQDDSLGEQTIVKWPELDPSSIMEWVQIFIPSHDSITGVSNSRLQNTTYTSMNKGHSYIDFWVDRMSSKEAVIRLKPYDGIGNEKPIYTIYKDGQPIGVATGNVDTIPIPFLGTGVQEYKIQVEILNQIITSQTLVYDASQDSVIPPPIPQIKDIYNVYAVPSLEKGKQPQAIGFDIAWSAPMNVGKNKTLDELVDEGTLYYEMLLHEKADPDSEPIVSHVFKVERENGQIVVKPYAGKAGKTGQDPKVRYDQNEGKFTMERVELKSEADTPWWNKLHMPEKYLEGMKYPEYSSTVNTEDAHKIWLGNNGERTTSGVIKGLEYTIPNTYYVTMKPVYDKNDVGSFTPKLTTNTQSLPIPVAFDETKEIVPIVEKIDSRSINQFSPKIAQVVTLDNVNIKNYYEKMLEVAGWELFHTDLNTDQYRRAYEIFLYQENDVKKDYGEADFNIPPEEFKIHYTEADDLTDKPIDMETYKDDLRKGKIIPIEYVGTKNDGKSNITLTGLDPNQVYYVKVKVRLEPWKGKDVSAPDKQYSANSLLSKVYSFTTDTTPLPPRPDEQTPPVPQEFKVLERPNNITVSLDWKAPAYIPEKGTDMYYEFIRATDKKLTDKELSRNKKVIDLVKEQDYFKAFTTSDDYIKTYDKKTSQWIAIDPLQSTTKLQITDNTLESNTIYYYYIRTVCDRNGVSAYSDWIMLPVTTNPVNPPIQLQVENPKVYTYDAKTESVVSFLAPIPKDKIDDVGGGKSYNIEVAVKGEKDEEYSTTKYSARRITSKEDQSKVREGYIHMVYQIDDLKPGSRYDIKVRLVDQTKPLPEGAKEYPSSLYTESVIARTEFDEKDQEKDETYDKYLERYESEVEKLRRKPYWGVDDNKYSATFKYRESYVNTEVALENKYTLVNEQGVTRLYYYLPATMLDEISKVGTVLEASLDGYTASIRPYTLTPDNDSIKEIKKKIKENKIEDYYIGVELAIVRNKTNIYGEETLSPEIYMDMELVELKEEDMLIEASIMEELEDWINTERELVKKKISKELEHGTIKEEALNTIIDNAIQHIKDGHESDVKKILGYKTGRKEMIGEIEKSILITAPIEAFLVNAYYLDGTWQMVPSFKAIGGFAVEAEKLGIYVFTGMSSGGGILPSIPNSQGIISQYNLTDFFKIDDYGLNQIVSKRQFYGSIARIMGAKRNVDYVQYLKARGIQGIVGGLDKGIRQDEAIYIAMQAYEQIYNKPINAITIKNKQSVQNIGAFQPNYRSYIYAGVELKIVPNPNGKVIPSKSLTTKEVIEILTKLVP
ncbi:MAG: hypothetical protein AB9856_16090 [Cellulosilyticaceae bacterium]